MAVKWTWACKKFDSRSAEIKLNSGLYHLLSDEGEYKVLGFKYVIENHNLPMPGGVYFVQDFKLLEKLDGMDGSSGL
jgi:hypothetical protein